MKFEVKKPRLRLFLVKTGEAVWRMPSHFRFPRQVDASNDCVAAIASNKYRNHHFSDPFICKPLISQRFHPGFIFGSHTKRILSHDANCRIHSD